jgi:hypothetical protein
MVLKMIRQILKMLLLILFVPVFSCEETRWMYDCLDCKTEEPATGIIELKIDPGFIPSNVIRVYQGNIEDNILIGTYNANNEVFNIDLTLNRKYTFTATYTKNNALYTAVDSTLPRVRDMKDKCDDVCYQVYDNKCDLRLKGI